MAKLIAPNAIVSKKAKLEHPVRVFAFAGISGGAEVGKYTYINRYTHIHSGVRMGRYCSIGRSVDIGAVGHPTDFLSMHPFQYNKLHFESVEGYVDFEREMKFDPQLTFLGHDVWIGAKGIVAAGVTVGTGAIIGAGSFVREDVPPYAVVVGTPARIIRYRFDSETIEKLLASNWWDLEPKEMAGVSFEDVPKALEQIQERQKAKEKQIQDSETETQQEDPAESKFVFVLRDSLNEMMVTDEVIEIILSSAEKTKDQFDVLDPQDQVILANKLNYLGEFLNEREGQELQENEKRHIATIFANKH